jgi:hypothetical protein
MAFYPNPNGIPVVPPFGRKGRPAGPQSDRATGPRREGTPTDATSCDPNAVDSHEGRDGQPAPTTAPETQKEHPMADQEDEFPTFVSLFANLVGMRTPMAPEAPGTPPEGPEGAPEADQEQTP